MFLRTTSIFPLRHAAALCVAACLALPAAATAQVTAFKQAIAETASRDGELAEFYRSAEYAPLWVGGDEASRARREALLGAVSTAAAHGLPSRDYSPDRVLRLLREAESERDRGRVEVEMSRMFLKYARDLQSGILAPNRVVSHIKREAPRREAVELLRKLADERPNALFRSLAPTSPEYRRLVRERLTLEEQRRMGGWGPRVPGGRLEQGDSGERVVALRNRLIAMDYLRRSPTAQYDARMAEAVQAFQRDHGLKVDGIAGESTLAEINRPIDDRIGQILVAMERERWLNSPDRGKRHVLVNLTDFKARIVDEGEVTFETKSIIGKDVPDRETPEFSDTMDHMVVNPSWYVPRSIVVNEYLPQLRRNPYALSHMKIVDRNGRSANRNRGFAQYNKSNFPFSMRQPPGPKNALGQVKFMFPNRYNIYLHDTPAQSLFTRDRRAFSHGCIRLDDPYEFAYALLERQESDPQGYFQNILNTRSERRVNLDQPVPVHLIYRTAFSKTTGGMEYRNDIYGRDAKILAALRSAGVAVDGKAS
ncbi:L,D-transpeptidase family protein [Tranquillimonas rosea]|uniref:L,D-transpeptidase family protein n=1 Tax=Tranquillimonas rosea TaxID=641238 RepID=UPI003BAA902D